MRKSVTDRIKFHFLAPRFYFPNRNALKAFLSKQLKKEGKSIEAINYIFCTDQYLLEMNQQYLNHDTFTDIITFELSPKGQSLVSDIYISVERVQENARQFQTSFQRELHRVIFHGALHLAGYKDKNKEQSELMRSKEDSYLQAYLIPRGTSKR
ncbi:MAG TPA: rRNA maturation RNase YbeY [Flavisolibacter sp.]|jgi:rRNA maturation RNase YbeY